MLQTTSNFDAENAKSFICETCDFKCSKQSNWNKHLLTLKHIKTVNDLQNTSGFNADQAHLNFVCECGKQYKHRQSLCKHKKICKTENIKENDQIDISTLDMNLVMQLLKQNDEFKSLMVEQNNKMMETFQETMQEVCKNGINNNSNNSINSHNKTFNLQVFLNEQCKDAMNIMEFVDTIKLDLDDAESVRKLGYVNGISNIIIKLSFRKREQNTV